MRQPFNPNPTVKGVLVGSELGRSRWSVPMTALIQSNELNMRIAYVSIFTLKPCYHVLYPTQVEPEGLVRSGHSYVLAKLGKAACKEARKKSDAQVITLMGGTDYGFYRAQ